MLPHRHVARLSSWLFLILLLSLTACQTLPQMHNDLATTGERDTSSASDPKAAQIESAIREAEAQRLLGHLDEAETTLHHAREQARDHPVLHALATQALGQVLLQGGQVKDAEPLLNAAWQAAQTLERPMLTALTANSLGQMHAYQGQREEALGDWTQALTLASELDDPGLQASAHINLASLSGGAQAMRGLRTAHQLARQVAPGEQTRLLLYIAEHGMRHAAGAGGLVLAAQALDEAAELATQHGLVRLHSQALGLEAQLAEGQGRWQASRTLAEQALLVAPMDADDLRYQWNWQLARALLAQGQQHQAVDAYRRAITHLERVRQDIPLEYAAGRSSFRETFAPLYLGFTDLLLRQAARLDPDSSQHQSLLREARDVVEQLRLDELRDYFNDPCVATRDEDIQPLPPRTAVLYPVILDDRLEILIGIDERLYRRSTPVDREQFSTTTTTLALKLRYEQPIEPEAQQLSTWLITPIESLLDTHQIETIVSIPDGALRMIPLAVLPLEGKALVERYAFATVPGLKLLQPVAFSTRRPNSLLAGLAQPGPVVNDLPGWWVDAMLKQYRQISTGTADSRGASVTVRGADARDDTAQASSSRRGADAVRALALPGVAVEIEQLQQRLSGLVLRDEQFLLERFVEEVSQEPYQIVHIASHGLFQGPPEDNFVVTYDHRLDMKTLAETLKPRSLSTRPVELLVLSACQTAEGDDRTPLGLSGVALQSGAHSALGSLWPVSDAATQLLMRHFYEALDTPGVGRGEALRRAQVTLLADERFHRPSDWAPFILVGSWL